LAKLALIFNLKFKGRKNGKGIYLYEEGVKGSDRPVNPGFTEIVKRNHVPAPSQIKNDAETIQWRLALKFVNEAVMCLQEGIINSPSDGDIGAVFGLGFPPMKGGPFKFVDIVGADKFVEKLNFYESIYGQSFKACDLLKEHAKDSSKKFYPN
jgi:enoyl-CoA hydratase / long-chain 3-hydroxyacyl-CoA dehydrogenase